MPLPHPSSGTVRPRRFPKNRNRPTLRIVPNPDDCADVARRILTDHLDTLTKKENR